MNITIVKKGERFFIRDEVETKDVVTRPTATMDTSALQAFSKGQEGIMHADYETLVDRAKEAVDAFFAAALDIEGELGYDGDDFRRLFVESLEAIIALYK